MSTSPADAVPGARVPDPSARKLQLEIEEIEAKLIELRRPWYKKPATILSAVAAGVAVTSLVLELRLSAIRRERNELEAAKAERLVEEKEVELAKANTQLESVRSEIADLSNRNRTLQMQRDEFGMQNKELIKRMETLTSERIELQKHLEGVRPGSAWTPADLDALSGHIEALKTEQDWLRRNEREWELDLDKLLPESLPQPGRNAAVE